MVLHLGYILYYEMVKRLLIILGMAQYGAGWAPLLHINLLGASASSP